jgi:cellulose biosynthesis protein BcsQ
MAKIIMFGNQKGGVGKSQCSIMTAAALSLPPFNLKTCIIDTDNQKSVMRIRNLDLRAYRTESVPFNVFDYKVADMQNIIGQLDKEYDIIIIDAAGKLDNDLPIETQEITKILMYVDCLFIPFVAGNHNLDATIEYFQFVRQVQKIRQLQARNLKVFGFINMHRSRSRANNFLVEDIGTIQASEQLEMMKQALNDYALFRDADTMTSIYGSLSNDSAKANFSAFMDEAIALIQ